MLLGGIIVITWAFAITLGIVTWIPICDTKSEEVGLNGHCVQIGTLLWIHIGSTICTIFADIVLSYLPWRILRSIHIPSGEKWGVGSSMSLVGLSALICIVRLGFAGYCEGYGNMPAGEAKKDWSYGYDYFSPFRHHVLSAKLAVLSRLCCISLTIVFLVLLLSGLYSRQRWQFI